MESQATNIKTPEIKQMISPSVADAEFERFAAAMDIDTDKSGMPDEDRVEFNNSKRLMTRAMVAGKLIINDNGEPVYSYGEQSLTFYEPTGADFLSMDGKGATAGFRKTFHLLSAITRTSPTLFGKMPNRDLKVCQAIVVFFIA